MNLQGENPSLGAVGDDSQEKAPEDDFEDDDDVEEDGGDDVKVDDDDENGEIDGDEDVEEDDDDDVDEDGDDNDLEEDGADDEEDLEEDEDDNGELGEDDEDDDDALLEDDEDDDLDDDEDEEDAKGKPDIPAPEPSLTREALLVKLDYSAPLEANENVLKSLQDFAWDDAGESERGSLRTYLIDLVSKEDVVHLVSPAALRVLRNMAGRFRQSSATRTQIEKDRAAEASLKDEEGHILAIVKSSPRIMYGFFCNKCGASYSTGPTYACEKCDWDVCVKCHAAHLRAVDEKYDALSRSANPKYDKWKPSKDAFNHFKTSESAMNRVSLYWSALRRRSTSPETNSNAIVSLACLVWQALEESSWSEALDVGKLADEVISHTKELMTKSSPEPAEIAEAFCGMISVFIAMSGSIDKAPQEAAIEIAIECLRMSSEDDFVAEEAFQLMIASSVKEPRTLGPRMAAAARARFGVLS